VVGIKHESMRKGQTSHKKEHNTRMCFPLKPVFTRDKGGLPNFIDEPTAGLDVVAREQILNMLREYMEMPGRSILISSHISSDLEGFCDDLYMIDNGKIVLHEETDRLLEEYGVLKVSKEQYQELDHTYILKKHKDTFGYRCLTDQKQFYQENYPGIVIEKGNIDELITIMIQGEKI
jgi:ABC-2 type transport system ATP-binding protein